MFVPCRAYPEEVFVGDPGPVHRRDRAPRSRPGWERGRSRAAAPQPQTSAQPTTSRQPTRPDPELGRPTPEQEHDEVRRQQHARVHEVATHTDDVAACRVRRRPRTNRDDHGNGCCRSLATGEWRPSMTRGAERTGVPTHSCDEIDGDTPSLAPSSTTTPPSRSRCWVRGSRNTPSVRARSVPGPPRRARRPDRSSPAAVRTARSSKEEGDAEDGEVGTDERPEPQHDRHPPAGAVHRRHVATRRHRSSQDAAIQSSASPFSSPEVAKSHAGGSVAYTNAPSGRSTPRRAWWATRHDGCRARPARPHSGRRPGHRSQRSTRAGTASSGPARRRAPGARAGWYRPRRSSGVEHGSVPVHDLTDDAEVDEAVVGGPPMAPAHPHDEHHRIARRTSAAMRPALPRWFGIGSRTGELGREPDLDRSCGKTAGGDEVMGIQRRARILA